MKPSGENCVSLGKSNTMHYIIVTGGTAQILAIEVNKKMEDGYVPLGGPFLGKVDYAQAMILKE